MSPKLNETYKKSTQKIRKLDMFFYPSFGGISEFSCISKIYIQQQAIYKYTLWYQQMFNFLLIDGISGGILSDNDLCFQLENL
jgi:hypothetical protein